MAQNFTASHPPQTLKFWCSARTECMKHVAAPTRNTSVRLGAAQGYALYPSFTKARGWSTGRRPSKARSVIVNTASSESDALAQEDECKLLVGIDVEELESRRVKFKKLKALCKKVGCKLTVT
eukprot:9092908-Pyramimonas_sp.AAC.2